MLLMPVLSLPSAAPSLADGVAEAVRDGVATGELVPGEVYSVYLVADLLGVSRSPVREGLLRLAEAGLVEIRKNRGFVVLRPDAHDIEEIFEIRLALEPAAARRAARHADDTARAGLRDLLARMEDAAARGDEPPFWSADRGLHDALLRATGNARAADIVDRLRSTTALLGPPTTATGRTLDQILGEHRPVVDAVLDRDGDRAEQAMRAHLEHTASYLARRLGPGDTLEG